MFKVEPIKIRKFDNGAWWVTTQEGQEYMITSINKNCTQKLLKIYKENEANEAKAFITLEKITQYPSDEYRAKISRIADSGWQDEDVYCQVSNETGNLNPNADIDIAAAKRRIEQLKFF